MCYGRVSVSKRQSLPALSTEASSSAVYCLSSPGSKNQWEKITTGEEETDYWMMMRRGQNYIYKHSTWMAKNFLMITKTNQKKEKRTIAGWWEEDKGDWVVLIKMIFTKKHHAWMANNIVMITKTRRKNKSKGTLTHHMKWENTTMAKLCLKLVKSQKHLPACDMQRHAMHHDHHENISNLSWDV